MRRILIVGAGPTGLTAAVELARRGVPATVIDRKEKPSTLSRAVGIMPGTLKRLEPSGVTERLLEEGIKIRSLEIFFGTRRGLSVPLAGAHPLRDYAVALAQDRTEEALRDALERRGGRVQYGAELTGLRQEGDGEDGRISVRTNGGAETAYDTVIGADGSRSATRQALGIDFPGYELDETWSIADVDAKNWDKGEALTFCFAGGGRVALVAPLEAERFRIVSNTESALETLLLPLEVNRVRREAQFRIAVKQVVAYRKGNVFLAGDAAHCHSPVGGRGMNLGIADAADLARRLVEGGLEDYGPSRRAAGAATIAESERARKFVTSPNPIKRAVVRAGAGLIDWLPVLQRRMARRFLDG